MRYLLTLLLVTSVWLFASAQWTQNQTLTGGTIVANVVTFKELTFVGTFNAGVFRSDNEGQSWTRVSAIQFDQMPYYLVIHNDELLAVSQGGQYRTSDGFQWAAEGGPQNHIYMVKSDGVNIFAATPFGIFQSADGGHSWYQTADAKTHINILSVAVKGQKVWAAANTPVGNVLFRSDNAGASWTQVLKSNSNQVADIIIDGSDVYLNVYYDGILKSTDNGAHWTKLLSTWGEGVLSNTSSTFYYFVDGRLYTSTDKGANWGSGERFLANVPVRAICPTPSHMVIGTWGAGMFRSNTAGGLPWTESNDGFFAHSINSLVMKNKSILVGGEPGFLSVGTSDATAWVHFLDAYGTPFPGRAITFAGTDLYVGEGGSGVHRGSNNGALWEEKSEGLTNKNIIALQTLPLSSSTSRTMEIYHPIVLYAATDDGVFVSMDRAEHWTQKFWVGNSLGVRCLSVDEKGAYVGTWKGLYHSDNQGDSWTLISQGLPDQSIDCIARIGSTLFVGTQFHGIYKTVDFGALWVKVSDQFALSMGVYQQSLFVGSFGKIFQSDDLGTTFADISQGLPFNGPRPIITAFAFGNEKIYAGTSLGYGLLEQPLASVVPLFFTYHTDHPGSRFRPGEPIFVNSDQELYGSSGETLETDDLPDYVSVKDSHDAAIAFQGALSDNKKVIQITLDNTLPGESYKVHLESFKNKSGKNSGPQDSELFTAVANLPPVAGNISLSIEQGSIVAFAPPVFTSGFIDEDDDAMASIIVTQLPLHGKLWLDAAEVQQNLEIPTSSLNQLTYEPVAGFTGIDRWYYGVFDGLNYSDGEAIVEIKIDAITGLEPATKLRTYPNPVGDALYISSPGGVTIKHIQLLDMTGKETSSLPTTSSADVTEVNISSLQSGMYLLKVQTDREAIVQRIVKK